MTNTTNNQIFKIRLKKGDTVVVRSGKYKERVEKYLQLTQV